METVLVLLMLLLSRSPLIAVVMAFGIIAVTIGSTALMQPADVAGVYVSTTISRARALGQLDLADDGYVAVNGFHLQHVANDDGLHPCWRCDGTRR
jgi:hypothetical protein